MEYTLDCVECGHVEKFRKPIILAVTVLKKQLQIILKRPRQS